MPNGILSVGLVRDVFFGAGAETRLRARLDEAKAMGAELAVLPELPLQAWCPAGRKVRDDDAEPPRGPRHRAQAEAARAAGIGLLGGAIVRDPDTGHRHNAALLFDDRGRLRSTYYKLHLPDEPGFWEIFHYEPGSDPPRVVEGFPLKLGIQICSDVNRPTGCHFLGAQGAHAILVPRATEPETFPVWRLVLRANALTSSSYLLSVGRPTPEGEANLGGPSIVVAPDGTVERETEDPVAVVRLEAARVEAAREAYPGYLDVRADLYAEWWGVVEGRTHYLNR